MAYDFWGMHLLWWVFWVVFLLWVFAMPYNIPGQRKKKDTPIDILNKQFASGQITTKEYLERRKKIEIF